MKKNVVAGNSDLMKQINRSSVLGLIKNHGPISKVELALNSKLTFASISNITTELLNSKLIEEIGYGGSSGGRKPVLYELNHDSFYVIGVEIGVSQIRTVIVNLNATIIVDYSVVNLPDSSKEIVTQQIFKSIDYVMTQVDRNKIAGIGISSPGPVDAESGIILAPPNLSGLNQFRLKDLVYERYGLPTLVEKDANASALGEQWFGSAKGKENLLFVLADQGIGGGIIINGRIYRGFRHGAGEIGHGTIDVDGPRCNCGNYGCLEAMASGIAITRRLKEEIRRGAQSQLMEGSVNEEDINLEQIINAALSGDKLAKDILEEAGRYLGIGVASLVNYFNPETIILGGILINSYPPMSRIIRELAKKRCFSHFAEVVTVQESLLGAEAGVIGAASLVIQYLFDSPDQIMQS
jgi:glucokinase-like ROK family protein